MGAVCGAALALGACAHVEEVKIGKCPVVTTDAPDAVDVRYLGVGGVLLSHKTDVLLTAPLYSNPSLLELTVDHDPSCMYYMLESTEPAGSFAFELKENGPEVWRAHVLRR